MKIDKKKLGEWEIFSQGETNKRAVIQSTSFSLSLVSIEFFGYRYLCVCLPVYSFCCNFACCQAERLQHRATSQFFAYFAENKLPRHNIK